MNLREVLTVPMGGNFKIVAAISICAMVAGAFFIRDREAGFRYFYERDFANARPELTSLAEKGDPFAAYFLGKIYLQGLDTDKSSASAKTWFLQSARRGFANGAVMYLYTRLSEQRDHSPVYCAQIIELLNTATRAKIIQAALLLGVFHANRRCGQTDLVKSAFHYTLARNMNRVFGQKADSATNQLSPSEKSRLKVLLNMPLRPLTEQQFLGMFRLWIDAPEK